MYEPSPPAPPTTLELSPDERPPDELPPTRQDVVQPYLSSVRAGWDGLVAQAFHEPRQFEGWLRPVALDFALTLITGGPMRLEWRHLGAQRSWTGLTVHHGDLILRPTLALPYEMRWWSASSVPTHTFNVFLPQEALAEAAQDLPGCDPAHLTLVERAGFQDPLLQQLALAVRRELHDGAPGGQLFAQCAVQLLTRHLVRHYTSLGDRPTILEPPHPLTPQQVHRVVAYVRDHASQDLSLPTLARLIGYSPHYFVHLFRQTTGETPHQLVRRERLAQARHLLEASDVPVAQVAAESGFADQSAFTRAFKRALGVTPHAYRREWRS
jgi:AraC family transcriptional regulator